MVFLKIFLAAMLAIAAANKEIYKAAVYEHIRVGSFGGMPWKQFVAENLGVYDMVAHMAASKGVDILVFPEYGIIPSAKHRSLLLHELETIPPPGINPCLEYGRKFSILRTLSCLSRETQMVIVANSGSRQPCNPQDDPWCPTDQNAYIFNTNVVFDRNGKLIGRYFKHHLFFEYGFNEPPPPYRNVSVFTTDFGTFGSFICFDLLHQESAEVVEKYNVTNVVYPTWWYDELPCHQAVQVQVAWAHRFQVNLLASNVHYPFSGSLGSGIFSGIRGDLISTHVPDGKARLLISEVPRNPRNIQHNATFNTEEIIIEYNNSDIFKKYHWRQTNLKKYSLVRLVKNSDHLEACNNFLCCNVKYKVSGKLNDNFVLAVFNGMRIIKNKYKIWEETCFITAFKGTLPKVDYPLESNTVFEEIILKGNFSTRYVFPSVMHSGHRVASASLWKTPDIKTLVYHDVKSHEPVLSAVLYGRNYDKDPLHFHKNPYVN